MIARHIFLGVWLSLLLVLGLSLLWWQGSQYRQLMTQSQESAVQARQAVLQDFPQQAVDSIWQPADRAGRALNILDQHLRSASTHAIALFRTQQEEWLLIWGSRGLMAQETAQTGLRFGAMAAERQAKHMELFGQSGWVLPLASPYVIWVAHEVPAYPEFLRAFLYRHRIVLLSFFLLSLLLAEFWRRRWGRVLRFWHEQLEAAVAGEPPRPTLLPSSRALKPMAVQLNALWPKLAANKRLEQSLEKYLSSAVVRRIGSDDGADGLQGEKRVISVLFCDLFQFTELTADLAPEKVVEILNICFEVLGEAVDRNQGFVDKYVGDGLMAIFGAPEDDSEHASHAVQAALDMQTALAARRRDLGLPELRVGIGINSGPAIVGTIGGSEKIEYTAIGAAVNLASRLEGFTRNLGAAIIVGGETAQRIGDEFVTERLDGVMLKGVRELQTVFRVHGRLSEGQGDR